jgi:hypothetical protein
MRTRSKLVIDLLPAYYRDTGQAGARPNRMALGAAVELPETPDEQLGKFLMWMAGRGILIEDLEASDWEPVWLEFGFEEGDCTPGEEVAEFASKLPGRGH